MLRSPRRFSRSLSIGTAAALGLSGLFIAPSAFAATTSAPVVGSDFAKYAQQLLTDDVVQAVGRNGAGKLVIVKTPESSSEVDEFTAANPGVIVQEISEPIETTAANDVVGGAGYYTDISATEGGLCSVGFTGWSPTGAPAVITAGHCAPDGATPDTFLTLPAGDATGNDEDVELMAELGTFNFAQYGGVGGTVGNEDTNSIDIGVIDVTNPALNLEPEVTTWENTADLSIGAIPITAVGKVNGALPIAKSGRTTQYSTAPAANIFITEGYAKISGRNVYGFGVFDLESTQGDSGGAIFQGGTAVGVVSGGAEAVGNQRQFVWGSDLTNALTHTGGYTVALTVAAPTLTSPANGGTVERGALITGTGPVSSTISVDAATGADFEVPTDAAGAFSFPAPAQLGAYAFTLQAAIGFSESPTNSYAVTVVPAPLLAPVITSPANGSSSTTNITAITGTAVPGSTITLTGDVTGTTTTTGAGTWSVETDLSYGLDYSVSVTQAFEGQTSPVATSTFNVVPAAAVITTPPNGSTWAAADAPTSISGTGIDGATITLIHNGGAAVTTTVVDGVWSFALGASRVGGNTFVVTQSIDGVATVTEAGYTVVAAAVAAVPGDPTLAATGADLMPAGGIAALLLLAGAAFLAIRKKRFGAVQN